jgi:cytochrome c-type biogenesis protein
MIDLNYPIAFGAGFVSFFAPCVVPLLPAYIGYVTGVSLKDLRVHGISPFRRKMITTSIFYILGFSLVFVALGTAAASVGQAFRRYDYLVQRAGGLLIILFGLEFAGVFHLPFLNKIRQFQLPVWTNKFGHFRAFFVGLVFATAWTPCVGAVLGSILALAAVTATAVEGASLLFVYSLGISIPFLVVSLTLASAPKYLKFINTKVGIISRIAGVILVILGVLLLTNTYKYLNSWLFETAFRFGYEIR